MDRPRCRPAFTLTELLISIAIIAILSGLGASAYSGAVQIGREQRTGAMITKIDQLIMERYESYRTRPVPLRVPAGTLTPRNAALARLNVLRELMRMELPDRQTDIIDPTANPPVLRGTASPGFSGLPLTQNSSLQRSYYRLAIRNLGSQKNLVNWTTTFEGAECLYLILSTMRDGDKSALDFFSSNEIGDVDGDGMKEIIDGWGMPIEFVRWPAGYAEQPGPDGNWGVSGTDDDGNGVVDDVTECGWPGSDDIVPNTTQTRNYLRAPDPFDPAKADPRWTYVLLAPQPYALYPLIFSAGRDKLYDIDEGSLVYSLTLNTSATPNVPPNDPYYTGAKSIIAIVGRFGDIDGDGVLSYLDNITNHDQASQ